MENQRFLPESGYFKANLHCHTTLSDGAFTPEEIKAAYKAQGYSIVAFTDHRKYVHHTELNDESPGGGSDSRAHAREGLAGAQVLPPEPV